MKRFLLAALALCALCSGADARQASVGGVAIELPPPAGYCELDERRHAGDKRLFDVTGTASPDTRLLAMSADCRQLGDWRAGRRPWLERYAQYQTPRALENGPLPAPPALLIKQTCSTLQAQGGDIASATGPAVNERLSRAMQEIEINRCSSWASWARTPTPATPR
jgi:hypothetical protein